MYNFRDYYEPSSLEATKVLLIDNPVAHIIAGGTDLLLKLKNKGLENIDLVSLSKINELSNILELENGYLRIGSMATFNQIMNDHLVNTYIPVLHEVLEMIGGRQIRNIATMGGNLCNGAPSADCAPILMTLDAQLVIDNEIGTKKVMVEDFYSGPFQVKLQQGDIVTAIEIPVHKNVIIGSHYIKYSMRRAMDISTLGCAATIILNDDRRIKELRLALGTAAPTPIRCRKTEQIVSNVSITEQVLNNIGMSAVEEASPRGSWRASAELRRHLIGELTKKAIRAAIEKTGGYIH